MPLGEPPPISQQESLRRYKFLHNVVVAVLVVAFVEFIMLITMQIQFVNFNHKVDSVSTSAAKAQDASNHIDQKVSGVIDSQINSPQAQENTRLTRQRIINMEYKLCGGPCPDAPTNAPSTNNVAPTH